MAKVLATEIRVGNLIEWEKRIWRVLKCYHVHVGGRGGAFMQVEMKDIEAGTKTNQRIRTEDKVERAFVEPREMTFLYQDGDNYIFMDKENYEQMSLSQDFLEGQYEYLLPNTDVQVNFHNDRAIGCYWICGRYHPVASRLCHNRMYPTIRLPAGKSRGVAVLSWGRAYLNHNPGHWPHPRHQKPLLRR